MSIKNFSGNIENIKILQNVSAMNKIVYCFVIPVVL